MARNREEDVAKALRHVVDMNLDGAASSNEWSQLIQDYFLTPVPEENVEDTQESDTDNDLEVCGDLLLKTFYL